MEVVDGVVSEELLETPIHVHGTLIGQCKKNQASYRQDESCLLIPLTSIFLQCPKIPLHQSPPEIPCSTMWRDGPKAT